MTRSANRKLEASKKDQRLRVFQRTQLSGQVYIHDDQRLFVAPLNNISAGGLFISGLTAIPIGAVVKIVVKSAKLEFPIQAKGTVVRVESDKRRGSAVEFTSINSHSREVIQNCVYESKIETALKVNQNAV